MSASTLITLNSLLAGTVSDTELNVDIAVTGMSLDSRTVQQGWIFAALASDAAQRFKYLQQALNKGCSAVLFDSAQRLLKDEVSALASAKVQAYPVTNLSAKVGEIAARFYDDPSEKMTVIAVTGTNGKTSVSQFIAQALEEIGISCGVIGTLGVGRINSLKTTGMTTPDPITMQAVLADFKKQAITHVVIEASSHALDQDRLNGVAIEVAILTNLSRDHLDYHANMADYAVAKTKLFDFVTVKTAVINVADKFGQTLQEKLATQDAISIITYSSQTTTSKITLQATAIVTNHTGIEFTVNSEFGSVELKSALLGRFNVDNLLAALSGLLAIDISFEQATQAIAKCHSVDGRMQNYGGENQVSVVIDFAHTPDALTQALQSLRPHVSQNGQLWCVFGCGGDRDKGKRPLMGKRAEENADKIVLTADNPRSESNKAIVNDILAGISKHEAVYIEHDRQLAITYAVNNAKSEDVVLVAGKGHEQYQEISGQKIAFSDSIVVSKALKVANDELSLSVGIQ